MDQEPGHTVLPTKNTSSLTIKTIVALIIGLTIGFAIGYFVRENTFRDLQKQITDLQNKNTTLQNQNKTPVAGIPKSPSRIEFEYGIKIPIPTDLGIPISSEAIIPLGTSGSYTVQSKLFNFN